MTRTLIVGVDPHRKQNVARMMDSSGQLLGAVITVDNNRPGTAQFVNQVTEQAAAGQFDQIQIATEATGWYWFHFFQTLSQDPTLNQWPVQLYAFNPRLTANFKKVFLDLDKDDGYDALVVAERLRLGRDLPQPFQNDDLYLPLRFLTRYRRHLVLHLVREKSYCLSMLYLKASEYTRADQRPFSNVFGATSRAVLQQFSSMEEIAAFPWNDLVEFIDSTGKRRFPNPADNARKLLQVAEHSYPLPETLQEPINTILHMSFQQISTLERLRKRLDTAIAQHLAPIPHTLDTIPGLDLVLSAGIISEIAGVERFDYDHAKVAQFAGLKWRHASSGDFQAEDTPLSRTGNPYLRYYLCEAANIVRMHDADYKAFYQRKYHEVRKHRHKRAIVLTARKLVRLVVRLLTTNQPYRPRRP